MICCVCGHDSYRVPSKPERYRGYELRVAQCKKCRTEFVIRSVVVAVLVVDPETESAAELPIERFDDAYREHLLGRAPHPSYRNRIADA